MKRANLEPGFLQAFRLFVAIQVLFWAIIGPVLIAVESTLGAGSALSPGVTRNLSPANTSRMIAVDLVLLAMLMLPQVPRRLGRFFLPLALLIAVGPLLVGFYWWPSNNPLQTPFVIFFVVMLVLIAWQYSFGQVLLYVLALSLYELLIAGPATGRLLGVQMGWLTLQAAMMSLVGYVIVTLVSTQREQRVALAQAYEQQAAANVRLKQYAVTLEELTISRERNRLARELHDTLAHSLSAVTVQLEAVRSLWRVNPEAAHDLLDHADETARTGLTEARRALQALRASPLHDLGLRLALQEMAQKTAERAGAMLDLSLSPDADDSLSPMVEQGVYRIAQEALENIVRHAQASTITVALERTGEELSLFIQDNGLGLQVDGPLAEDQDGDSGLGIRGMRERAELIGGQLEITSEAGEGTHVYLRVPV